MSRMPGKRRERLIAMADLLNAGDGGDRLYRALVETSTDVIAMFHLDGRVAYVNGAAREILGYEPDEVWGQHISDFTASEELPGLEEEFQRVMGGEVRVRLPVKAARKDDIYVLPMPNA